MGDHICTGIGADLSPPLDENDVFESQFTKPPYPKNSHTPPPVETGTSGHTYMHRGQLTPISQPSESRHASPVPLERQVNSRGTDETYQSRKTSEDTWEGTKSTSLPRRPGGYGGFDDSIRDVPDKSMGETFLDKMSNSIPGPFDPARRPSISRNAYPQRKDSLEKWDPPNDMPAPPRLPKKDGYEGFGAPNSSKSNNQGSLIRSETYPKLSPSTDYPQTQRAPSAPGPRPDRSRDTNGHRHERKKSMGPDTSRKPPPRTSLLPEHKYRNTASVDLAAEFGVGNPYHISTSSASSGYSNFSIGSQTTAQTSPARSPVYKSDLNQGAESTQSFTGNLKPPKDLRIDSAAASSHRFAPDMFESPYGISPKDDRFERPSTQIQQDPPSRGRYNSSTYQDGDYVYGGRRNDSPAGSTGWRQDTWGRQDSRGQTPLPSRGDCKACGIAITGKSISSADGRLTGKYHKACFVCYTCSEPFSSSVFYVHNDKPYCEHHYHKLNNSLCGSCRRGIEGRFAEDEAKVKYHVGCFRCLDCGTSLADGYFEVGGYSYCERDAWKRVQSQAYVEQEAYQPGPPRGALGARIPNGLPARPGPRPGQGRRPNPPPPNGIPNGGRLTAGADQRLRMNKRMTRLGNMNR
ncbi:hypothetical protein QQS21_009610 [Conoideocrella luteorostrata]|uniref:LIM zinc-binding domain-containing protein n=1 Tax=Conoideocrella luteorostrata TaxID=1105319 RepID=A0AAJ0FXM4_9HYPO|nr:hypothetical protein QQS21_009610 [Conoideocrella luteorostrata]